MLQLLNLYLQVVTLNFDLHNSLIMVNVSSNFYSVSLYCVHKVTVWRTYWRNRKELLACTRMKNLNQKQYKIYIYIYIYIYTSANQFSMFYLGNASGPWTAPLRTRCCSWWHRTHTETIRPSPQPPDRSTLTWWGIYVYIKRKHIIYQMISPFIKPFHKFSNNTHIT